MCVRDVQVHIKKNIECMGYVTRFGTNIDKAHIMAKNSPVLSDYLEPLRRIPFNVRAISAKNIY